MAHRRRGRAMVEWIGGRVIPAMTESIQWEAGSTVEKRGVVFMIGVALVHLLRERHFENSMKV